MKNRKKVILQRRDDLNDNYRLALTQEQINLLNWLLSENLVDPDYYDIQVLEDEDTWVEV